MRVKLPAIILSIFFILALPTIAQAAILREGSTGTDVKTLQTEFNQEGYTVGPVDGIFGPKTKAGVLKFQTDQGLTTDGIAGPVTQAALDRRTKTQEIISTAKTYLGVKYVWGGTTPAGFDCSGFVQYVFKDQGIILPRVSKDQATVGTAIRYKDLQPGDLMFFSMNENGVVSHVGIYIGGGTFIGAENAGVRVVTLDQYWISRFVVARRDY
ncbi:NlpC/P60 family protein [Desulfosporosinus sp. Sb-LF]|uniref:C40 family peptidase n=1 Tax=Desulfosporosinus sp. Sb-LF TaxID=2560027 RepID=UPI00107FBFA5|nr:NlpC/P60 family protein [Desulfosporosinus sp. Sb-LF]TGE33311.1 hydrolase [Desulfosporosinus sp. Sb-LF]